MSNLHKSNRSLLKRIKITGNGKILKRAARQNHFNAKNTGAEGLKKHGQHLSPTMFAKGFQFLLPAEHISSKQQ
jgi:ribosomal protein L35